MRLFLNTKGLRNCCFFFLLLLQHQLTPTAANSSYRYNASILKYQGIAQLLRLLSPLSPLPPCTCCNTRVKIFGANLSQSDLISISVTSSSPQSILGDSNPHKHYNILTYSQASIEILFSPILKREQTTRRQVIRFLDSHSHSDMANRSHHIAWSLGWRLESLRSTANEMWCAGAHEGGWEAISHLRAMLYLVTVRPESGEVTFFF
jgi:hypothetical protein